MLVEEIGRYTLSLVLSYARSINNKISVLWDSVLEQDTDLAYETEIWVEEGKTVALNQFTSPGCSVLHQFQEFGWGAVYLRIFFSSGHSSHTRCLVVAVVIFCFGLPAVISLQAAQL